MRLLLEFAIAGFATWLMVGMRRDPALRAVRTGAGGRPRLALHRLRRLRDRVVRQCGELDRRARRAGDDAGDHRLDRVHADRLPRRQREVRHYLGIPHVPGAGDLTVLLLAIIGAGLAFLWFNAPPAAVFMGDTGSLALGGALGAVAVATHHEFVLVIIGGLFVLEAVSVVVQVFWFKRYRQAGVQDGADPPSFRTYRLERADGGDPLLDHQLHPRAGRAGDAEAAVITAKAFAGQALCGAGACAERGWRRSRRCWRAGRRVTAWDDDPRLLDGSRAAAKAASLGQDSDLRRSARSPTSPPPTSPNSTPSWSPPACRSIATRSRRARKDADVEIIGDIELFARARPELPPHKVVGITGTNGKSTTTALVHHILQTAGVPSLMGGNIGLPILAQEPLPRGRGLCARTVELPDRPDQEPRLRRRGAAQHHARPSRSV